MSRRTLSIAFFLFAVLAGPGWGKILIPMDLSQTNHLKAYGVAYHALQRGQEVEWLLNYRGGSFLMDDDPATQRDCALSGVSLEERDGGEVVSILDEIEKSNMEVVLLEKAPTIAVYYPAEIDPWDDAVVLALDYAEIPYVKIWDEEVVTGELSKYDWLHLHHEDFTGQYGKFYASYRSAPWYVEQVRVNEEEAKKLGFAKVWQLKQAVAARIKEYVARGGFVFSMCSATDSFDIALAAQGIDIVDTVYDGDPPDPRAQEKLDYLPLSRVHRFPARDEPAGLRVLRHRHDAGGFAAGAGERLLPALRFLGQGGPGSFHADPVPCERPPRVHGPDDELPEVVAEEVDDHPGRGAGRGRCSVLPR